MLKLNRLCNFICQLPHPMVFKNAKYYYSVYDGTFVEASNGRHVVAEGVDGSIGCPFLEGYHLQLHEEGGLFQVAVGEGA